MQTKQSLTLQGMQRAREGAGQKKKNQLPTVTALVRQSKNAPMNTKEIENTWSMLPQSRMFMPTAGKALANEVAPSIEENCK